MAGQEIILYTHTYGYAVQLLSSAHSHDFYYSKMNDTNKKARRGAYVVSHDLNRPSVETFQMPNSIPFTTKRVDIIVLDPSSDGGLPHTRGNENGIPVICMPSYYVWTPNDRTMTHELVHISQKQEPERWWRWYSTNWKFEKLEDPSVIPEKWRGLARRNPDTLDSPFVVWKQRYVPITVFTNLTSPDLRVTERGFYDLLRNTWVWEAPPGWDSMFGQGFNDEHPHEIAAHWIDGSGGAERQKYFNLHPV